MKLGSSAIRGLAVAAAILVLGVAAPAPAQEAGAQQPGAQQFTQGEIESFAAAALKVNQIRGKWLPRLRAAASPEEAAAMEQKGMSEIVAAIEGEGLTVEKYNAIVETGNGDPALREQILELMKAGQGAGTE